MLSLRNKIILPKKTSQLDAKSVLVQQGELKVEEKKVIKPIEKPKIKTIQLKPKATTTKENEPSIQPKANTTTSKKENEPKKPSVRVIQPEGRKEKLLRQREELKQQQQAAAKPQEEKKRTKPPVTIATAVLEKHQPPTEPITSISQVFRSTVKLQGSQEQELKQRALMKRNAYTSFYKPDQSLDFPFLDQPYMQITLPTVENPGNHYKWGTRMGHASVIAYCRCEDARCSICHGVQEHFQHAKLSGQTFSDARFHCFSEKQSDELAQQVEKDFNVNFELMLASVNLDAARKTQAYDADFFEAHSKSHENAFVKQFGMTCSGNFRIPEFACMVPSVQKIQEADAVLSKKQETDDDEALFRLEYAESVRETYNIQYATTLFQQSESLRVTLSGHVERKQWHEEDEVSKTVFGGASTKEEKIIAKLQAHQKSIRVLHKLMEKKSNATTKTRKSAEENYEIVLPGFEDEDALVMTSHKLFLLDPATVSYGYDETKLSTAFKKNSSVWSGQYYPRDQQSQDGLYWSMNAPRCQADQDAIVFVTFGVVFSLSIPHALVEKAPALKGTGSSSTTSQFLSLVQELKQLRSKSKKKPESEDDEQTEDDDDDDKKKYQEYEKKTKSSVDLSLEKFIQVAEELQNNLLTLEKTKKILSSYLARHVTFTRDEQKLEKTRRFMTPFEYQQRLKEMWSQTMSQAVASAWKFVKGPLFDEQLLNYDASTDTHQSYRIGWDMGFGKSFQGSYINLSGRRPHPFLVVVCTLAVMQDFFDTVARTPVYIGHCTVMMTQYTSLNSNYTAPALLEKTNWKRLLSNPHEKAIPLTMIENAAVVVDEMQTYVNMAPTHFQFLTLCTRARALTTLSATPITSHPSNFAGVLFLHSKEYRAACYTGNADQVMPLWNDYPAPRYLTFLPNNVRQLKLLWHMLRCLSSEEKSRVNMAPVEFTELGCPLSMMQFYEIFASSDGSVFGAMTHHSELQGKIKRACGRLFGIPFHHDNKSRKPSKSLTRAAVRFWENPFDPTSKEIKEYSVSSIIAFLVIQVMHMYYAFGARTVISTPMVEAGAEDIHKALITCVNEHSYASLFPYLDASTIPSPPPLKKSIPSMEAVLMTAKTTNAMEIVQGVKNGQIHAVTGSQVIDEGADFTGMDSMCMYGSSSNKQKELQRQGRIQRSMPEADIAKLHRHCQHIIRLIPEPPKEQITDGEYEFMGRALHYDLVRECRDQHAFLEFLLAFANSADFLQEVKQYRSRFTFPIPTPPVLAPVALSSSSVEPVRRGRKAGPVVKYDAEAKDLMIYAGKLVAIQLKIMHLKSVDLYQQECKADESLVDEECLFGQTHLESKEDDDDNEQLVEEFAYKYGIILPTQLIPGLHIRKHERQDNNKDKIAKEKKRDVVTQLMEEMNQILEEREELQKQKQQLVRKIGTRTKVDQKMLHLESKDNDLKPLKIFLRSLTVEAAKAEFPPVFFEHILTLLQTFHKEKIVPELKELKRDDWVATAKELQKRFYKYVEEIYGAEA